MLQQVARPLPGTLTRVGGGGLGSSGGMALGAKLARPDRLAIQIVGDGSFYFNVETSVLAVSKQYKLPIFCIVLDNGGWSAVKESTLRVYPEGDALASENAFGRASAGRGFRASAGPSAYGEKLTDPAKGGRRHRPLRRECAAAAPPRAARPA